MKEKLYFISRFLIFFWLVTLFITFSLLCFRWLSSIKYQLISEDLRLWEIYLPVILSFYSVAFLLRPRFRERFNTIYKHEFDKWIKNGYIIQLFLLFFISFMLLTYSQKYFSGTFGDLVIVKSLDEISEHPRARFFKIDSVSYNPYYGVFLEKNRRSLPSKNTKLIMNHYIVNPLYNSRMKYYKPPLTYWMALHTQERVSIRQVRKDNSIVKEQWVKVYDQIDTYDINQVDFFYKTPASGLLDDYREAIKSRYGENIARKAVVLEPKAFSFEERAENIISPFRVFIISFPLLIFFLLIHKR